MVSSTIHVVSYATILVLVLILRSSMDSYRDDVAALSIYSVLSIREGVPHCILIIVDTIMNIVIYIMVFVLVNSLLVIVRNHLIHTSLCIDNFSSFSYWDLFRRTLWDLMTIWQDGCLPDVATVIIYMVVVQGELIGIVLLIENDVGVIIVNYLLFNFYDSLISFIVPVS